MNSAAASTPNDWLRRLAGIGVAVIIAILASSAYLRLTAVGFGCDDWPLCYAQSSVADKAIAGSFIGVTRLIHRLSAIAAGAIVLLVAFFSWAQVPRKRTDVTLSSALLVLTVFLAALGRSSGSVQSPGVVLGNLVGGMSMLLIMWWLYLRAAPASNPPTSDARRLAPWAIAVFASVFVQLVLGALATGHRTALACEGFPDCGGIWWPPELSLFDPLRNLDVQLTLVQTETARQALHMAHRFGALAVLAFAGIFALRSLSCDKRDRMLPFLSLAIVLGQASLGILAVTLNLPLALIYAHHLGSIALLLAVSASAQRATATI